MIRFWLIIFGFSWLSGQAQAPVAWQLTQEQGLPSMSIYNIVQDKAGYLWLGTHRGLYRYDGRQFEAFPIPRFIDQEIVHMQLDPFGRLWFNNLSHEIGWLENDSIKLLQPDLINNWGKPQYFVWVEDQLFVSYRANAGQLKYARIPTDAAGNLLAPVRIGSKYLSGMVNIVKWGDKYFFSSWRLTKNQLFYNYIDNDSIYQHASTLKNNFSSDEIYFQNIVPLEANLGGLLIAQKENIFHFKKGTFSILKNIPNKSIINKFILLEKKIYILTNGDGIHVLDKKNLDYLYSFLPGMNINNIYQDVENNFWVATTGNGLLMIPNFQIKRPPLENSSLKNKEINSLFTDSKNQLYTGTNNGELFIFPAGEEKGQRLLFPDFGRITHINEDHLGRIWLACDAGICYYDPTSGKQQHNLINTTIKTIAFDHEQSIWLGESNWVRKSNIRPQDQYLLTHQNLDYVHFNRTYALLYANNRMWIGTTSGIFYHEKDSIHTFYSQPQEHFPYRVTHFLQNEGESIWVGTLRQGLLLIDKDGVIKKYDRSNGLASNNILQLAKHEQSLFIGTDNGLNILDIASGVLTHINQRDGLPSNEINALSFREGKLWVGTPKGLINFAPEHIFYNTHAPPIYITGLNINGRDTSVAQHTLRYDQNAIEVTFAGLSLRARGHESYRYRLAPLNTDWIATDKRSARFHALPPGQYTFEVIAINEDDTASTQPAQLTFNITTPWWRQWWFRTLLLFGLISLSGALVYWRQRELRQRERTERSLQDKIQQLRLDALRTQMNPHFIYNSLNAIQDFLVTENSQSAIFYLSRFAQLIRLIFDYSQREIVSLEDELTFLQLYLDLEQLRFGDRVKIDLVIPEVVEQNSDVWQLPPLLIQPIIENAFKHGLMHKIKGGHLRIEFSELPHQRLQCIIEDNGIGREQAARISRWKAKPGAHSSLIGIRKRLEMFHSGKLGEVTTEPLEIIDLTDAQGAACGTRVVLII